LIIDLANHFQDGRLSKEGLNAASEDDVHVRHQSIIAHCMWWATDMPVSTAHDRTNDQSVPVSTPQKTFQKRAASRALSTFEEPTKKRALEEIKESRNAVAQVRSNRMRKLHNCPVPFRLFRACFCCCTYRKQLLFRKSLFSYRFVKRKEHRFAHTRKHDLTGRSRVVGTHDITIHNNTVNSSWRLDPTIMGIQLLSTVSKTN
jgi:hypothetical protein